MSAESVIEAQSLVGNGPEAFTLHEKSSVDRMSLVSAITTSKL